MCFFAIVRTKKPSSKRHLSVWQLECELGMIADPECPIDGGWSPWSPWTECQGQCDDIGHRHRTRECSNPPPSQEGSPCSGSDEQTEVCYLTNCTVDDFRKLVAGDTARMKAFLHLQTVPALMERCLQMECPFEAIEAVLTIDNTWQLNSESLWNALQCVKRNLGCPIIGEWGAWGAWSACGARCGHGLTWRLRRCDTPPPSDVSLACSGSPLQADDCVGDQCAINSHDSGGSWGEWSEWSACSEKCGIGVKRRKRICRETKTQHVSGTWGTHCRGQHDELEICENRTCNLDGGWSGWGAWGPCSQTCGAGKQSRTRSCTRPIPAEKGKPCIGLRTEVGSCHLMPCEGFSHTVALLHGESSLHYNFRNRRATLYHFYIRFLPLSPHGTLVRRETGDGSYVRLSLQKWHVCLDACGASRSCCLLRSCSHSSIEPGAWHSALVTVTIEGAALRLDDALISLKNTWPCDPDLPDDNLNIYIGDKIQGQIQELILNFIPLKMFNYKRQRSQHSDFYPIAASNVAFQKSSILESYLRINNDHYLRIPCFERQDEWQLELTLKPKKEAGTILFLKNDESRNWVHLYLQNMRLKLKVAFDDFRSESSSTIEYPPDKWFDVILSKKQATKAIEASVNAGERLHVIFEEVARKGREIPDDNHTTVAPDILALCTDEFFIGGVPNEVKQQVLLEDFTALSAVLASVKLNHIYLDLHAYSLERYKDNKLQVSSRTASVSGSYHETGWGKSNRLNLTCLHARTTRLPHAASWLFLDTTITGVLDDRPLRSVDDGRILRLIASADNDLRGFYTCRAHSNRHTANIVTYGVLGKTQYKLRGPDKTTAIAVFTTLTLVLGTLLWLFIEGIHDLRNGYGFFRDAHFSPEEEAEAVCKYIDQNINLIHSKSAAHIAKAKARRNGRLAASRANFAAQEPQGLMEENLQFKYSLQNEPCNSKGLATVPEVKSSSVEPSHVFRFEPCYISSPRHGLLTSPRTRVTSSSSFELVSPRVLCSKLLVTKGFRSSTSRISLRSFKKEKTRTPESKTSQLNISPKHNTGFMNPTAAQKILQKFRNLKSDDY